MQASQPTNDLGHALANVKALPCPCIYSGRGDIPRDRQPSLLRREVRTPTHPARNSCPGWLLQWSPSLSIGRRPNGHLPHALCSSFYTGGSQGPHPEGHREAMPLGLATSTYDDMKFCLAPGEPGTNGHCLLMGLHTAKGEHMRLRDVFL